MPRKKHSPEQIVAMLRQIEAAIANNEPTPQACREAGVTLKIKIARRKTLPKPTPVA